VTFNDYLLTLDGMSCIVWISELSLSMNGGEARFALAGVLEVHQDFVIVHGDEGEGGTAVKIVDIKCIEACPIEDDEDLDLSDEEDLFIRFEKFYKDFKGE
jgi:hypothetical protein